MVNPAELRIGNYINVDRKPVRVTEIAYYGINTDRGGIIDAYILYAELQPIKLTPEIILKAGFIRGKNQSTGFYGYSDKIIELDNDLTLTLFDGRIEDDLTKLFVPDIQYLHQLQNLYFALNNEELKINL